MKAVIVQEGAITWDDSIKLENLPNPLPSGIRLLAKGGKVGIEVQGLAGAIPLSDGSTLRILPKVGDVNFFRLLFIAEGNQKELNREYQEFVAYSLSEGASVEQIAARQLLEAIGEILRRSPMADRRSAVVSSNFSKGKLLPVATALRMAQKNSMPVVSCTKIKSANTPENRILTEACLRAYSMLGTVDQDIHKTTYNRWLDRFPRSSGIEVDLEKVERKFARNGYGGPRGYYQKALMLARIILGTHGFSTSADQCHVLGDAILINTADIFEKYLRRIIQHTHEADGYIVTKGDVGSESLYTDGSFSLEPDILIEKRGKVALVADAKYKSPTGPDHYQMYVYLKRYSAKCGVLICPNFDSTEVRVREYLTPDKLVIRELHVPMDDLDRTEATLASLVRDYSSTY